MTMKKLIEVYNGINKTYYCRYDLNAFGLSFKKTGKYSGKWVGKADEDKANAIEEYCICLLYTSYINIWAFLFKFS